jgi:hypothetical protein
MNEQCKQHSFTKLLSDLDIKLCIFEIAKY